MKHGILTGNIKFSSLVVPVVLYPAIKPKSFKLHLLDKRDLSAVGFKKINKVTGQDVSKDQLIEGYEYQPGSYVTLSLNELEKVRAETTHEMNIIEFVRFSDIDPLLFDKHYYLEPKKNYWHEYVLLREALQQTVTAGLVKMALYARQYLAVIRPLADGLMLDLLRFINEVRTIDDLELNLESFPREDINKTELSLAMQVINNMTKKWDPGKYKNDYRDEVLELINNKIKLLKRND